MLTWRVSSTFVEESGAETHIDEILLVWSKSWEIAFAAGWIGAVREGFVALSGRRRKYKGTRRVETEEISV